MLTLQHAKRVIKVVVGFTLVAVGILLLVLPGPGLIVIVLGLALLAGEFVWANRLLVRVKAGANSVRNRFSPRGH